MDILQLTKSRTRRKILKLFLADPDKMYYLHEIRKELSLSAGNLRRELLALVGLGLFHRIQKGRLVYYIMDVQSPIFTMIQTLADRPGEQKVSTVVQSGFQWVSQQPPGTIAEEWYCQTRDVFGARLETFATILEKRIGADAYLIAAVAGEIGNNSFDHNLGRWRDTPGVYFAYAWFQRTIVLADRGQGILKTIHNVLPEVKDDQKALAVAFTKIISGRFPEKRGNGLKFVVSVLRNKKWSLRFDSGRAGVILDRFGKMGIQKKGRNIGGCFAVITY